MWVSIGQLYDRFAQHALYIILSTLVKVADGDCIYTFIEPTFKNLRSMIDPLVGAPNSYE